MLFSIKISLTGKIVLISLHSIMVGLFAGYIISVWGLLSPMVFYVSLGVSWVLIFLNALTIRKV